MQSISLPSSLRRPWALFAVAAALLTSSFMVISANAATLAITTTSADLHDGAVGQPYASETLAATGGTSPYIWSVQGGAGSLPAGLSLSSAGVITGTPTALGNTTFTVRVIDDASNMATKELTIKVNSAVVVQTTALPPAPVSSSYPATQLVATGGTGTYTWTVSAGTLAPLTLSAAGVISGTTPAAPTTLNFTVQATDSAGHSDQQALSIAVTAAGALTITTASLPNGVQNALYPAQTLTASGGTGSRTWVLDSGSLPGGLSLSSAGVLGGTPNATGTFTFTVKVTDSTAGTPLTATKQFTISVMAPIEITTASPLSPEATVGAPYSKVLAATGGTPPYSWAVVTPPPAGLSLLPAGLSMSASTGAITGTPTTTGTTSFAVQVTDFFGYVPPGTPESFSLTVNAANALVITTTSLPNALAGADYTQQLTKTGGAGTFTWSVIAGAPPSGLTLDPATGLITGTAPATLGTSTFTVRVVGSVSGDDTQQLSITVSNIAQRPNQPRIDDDVDNRGHGNNHHGLCNAFFSGSEHGRKQKAKSMAFLRLIEAAGATGDWEAVQEKVRIFCDQNGALNLRHHDDDDDDDDDDEDEDEIQSSNSGRREHSNSGKSKGKSGGQGRDD